MPESRESVSQESRLSQESMDLPMDYNDDFDVDPENAEDGLVESSLNRSRDSAKSIESLNTLLMRMPEIHIPTLVHNPLPLQCLAASALPPELRREIDGVIAEYVCDEELLDVCAAEEVQHQQEPAAPANAMLESATAMAGDNGTKETVEQVDSAQQDALAEDCKSETVEVQWTVLKKQPTLYDDLGVGLKIMGGVRCDRCHNLHAVVTSVFASSEDLNADIKEGVCISKWGNQFLDGCSFERVQRILEADTGLTEVEVGFMKCSENLLSSRRGRDLSEDFTAAGTNEVGNVTNTVQVDAEDYPDNGESRSCMDCSKRNSLSVNLVSTKPAMTSDVPIRPSSLKAPPSNTSSQLQQEDGRRERSTSRSVSPAPNGERKANITVPKLDSTAQALMAAMEARPKSPLLADNLQHIFEHLPSGCVQLSIKFDSGLADLSISLNQVKGQSLGDIFINTYLIPDVRQQGVRSVKVSSSKNGGASDGSPDSQAAYIITESELSSVALRVILWDAKKSKNMTFRGEVLLGLSDDIVNLGGEPTWYNVCPEDPNLPPLPPPVHYKSKSHVSMEQLLNRFKTTLKFKSSRSMMSSLDLSASDSTVSLPLAIMKRRRSVPRGRLQTTGVQDSLYADNLQGDGECSGTRAEDDTKAQMARLAKMLKVLKDSAESDDAQSADDALDTTDNKELKKNKLQSILRVLREDTSCSSSDSGDNLEDSNESTDGNHLCPITPSDDGTFSTLDRRVRRRRQHQSSTRNSAKSLRPKSDSFNMIPTLRGSLNGRKGSMIPTFSFLEEMQGSIQLSTQRESSMEDLDSMDDDERSDATFAEHYRLIDDGQSDNEQEPRQPTLPQVLIGEESHLHVDPCLSLVPTATSKEPLAKPSDYTRYPVEVSLHRINVVDVDRENMERESKRKARSMPYPPKSHKKSLAMNLDLSTTPEVKSSKSIQGRSKSLGDMDDIESEEEIILVRSPMTPRGELDGGSIDHLDMVVPFPEGNGRIGEDFSETNEDIDDVAIHIEEKEREESFTVSSLDFSEHPRPRNASMVRVNDKEERGEKSGNKNMSKWRSLDNLLTGSLPRTKKNKKKHLGVKASLNRMNSVPADNNFASPGNVEIELQYNDLNPLHPVLLVKLTDVVFFSSKGLTSEFTMKSYVYHRSTKVCILKNKTNINMKMVLSSAPLGLVQFETDITNLSLQVCLFTNSKLFSRKLIGEVWIELDTLSLSHDSPHSEWYSLSRQNVQS